MTSVLRDQRTAPRRDLRRRARQVPATAATAPARRLAVEQLTVAGGQLGAGAGNLLFALVAARVLEPEAFAQLAAFLALYLVIHVPAGSLSAGSALTPELAARARRRVLGVGLAAGGALAALALPLATLLELSPALLFAAAAAAPTAGLLALDRGRLYGLRLLPRAVGSLLAEPAVRLTFGVALALVVGPIGAAAAVVVAGWAALAVAQLPPRAASARAPRAGNGASFRGSRRATGAFLHGAGGPLRAAGASPRAGNGATRAARPTAGVIGAFLLLAVVQNQDVLLANSLLPGPEAARFAVLSTLGGAAAFATTTVPLMLLGRRDDRRALGVALTVAAALGAVAVAVVALSPGALVGTAFGGRYADVGAIAVPYLLAMALLGVARVLVAHACATCPAARVVALLAAVAALQTVLIVLLGDDAAGMVTATLLATAGLTAGAGTLALPRPLPLRGALALVRRRDVVLVAALTLVGFGVRLASSRGIWLDEATSIWQAQMSLPDMLHTLRTNDVHPPLHHVVLWATVRVLGTGELAVRLPSLLAATALIPLLYAAGRDVYDRRAGIAAAVFGTVAPFTVWYAQEARMYALFMLLALLAVWLQVRVLRGGGRRDWIGFTLASFALVATQYFGILLVGVQQLAFVVALVRRRGDRALALPWLASTAALALMLAPLLSFGQAQFEANEAAGKGFQKVPSQTGGALGDSAAPPGPYAALTNAVWALFGYHSDATMTRLVALWPLLMLLVLALLGRGRSWRTALIVAAAGLPALALFGLGQIKPFVFEARYFIGAVPLALLLAARATTSWSPRLFTQVAAGAVAAALFAGGLADQQLNGNNPRVYDFRGALQDIAGHARPGDLLVYSPQYLDHVVDYYAPGVKARPLDAGLPRPRRGHRVIVLGSFLDKPQFRQATTEAVRTLERRHRLARERRYPQIRVWEFTR